MSNPHCSKRSIPLCQDPSQELNCRCVCVSRERNNKNIGPKYSDEAKAYYKNGFGAMPWCYVNLRPQGSQHSRQTGVRRFVSKRPKRSQGSSQAGQATMLVAQLDSNEHQVGRVGMLTFLLTAWK